MSRRYLKHWTQKYFFDKYIGRLRKRVDQRLGDDLRRQRLQLGTPVVKRGLTSSAY